eukprot:6163609-Pyramimonas_sp.AAC.1
MSPPPFERACLLETIYLARTTCTVAMHAESDSPTLNIPLSYFRLQCDVSLDEGPILICPGLGFDELPRFIRKT